MILSLGANEIYSILNDFAFEKKESKNLNIVESRVLTLKKDNQKCLEILLNDKEVRILNIFEYCENLSKNSAFKAYLENEFFDLYKNDYSEFINLQIKNLQRAMQDIMLYYKLHLTFTNDLKTMSKLDNLKLENLDKKEGGNIYFLVENRACVELSFLRINEKMAMFVKALKSNEKNCQILTNSPSFKQLSLIKDEVKSYILD